MVAGLFALALLSFALMGLFVVALTIYSGLTNRARRVDEAARALSGPFASRLGLLDDAEQLAVSSGRGDLAEQARQLRLRVPPVEQLDERAAWDAESRACLAGIAAGAPPAFAARVEEIERAVPAAIRAYNDAVTEFNQSLSLLPAALIARVAGLDARRLLRG